MVNEKILKSERYSSPMTYRLYQAAIATAFVQHSYTIN